MYVTFLHLITGSFFNWFWELKDKIHQKKKKKRNRSCDSSINLPHQEKPRKRNGNFLQRQYSRHRAFTCCLIQPIIKTKYYRYVGLLCFCATQSRNLEQCQAVLPETTFSTSGCRRHPHSHTCAGGVCTNASSGSVPGDIAATPFNSHRFHHGGPAVSDQCPYDWSAAQGEEQSKNRGLLSSPPFPQN